MQTTLLKTWFNTNVKDSILTKMEEFEEKESGWTLISIIDLEININKYTQILSSSHLELPEPFNRKRTCINVKNEEEKGFMWAVL